MFEKKFLSFIGLLLICNQFVNVSATAPASRTFIDENGSLHSGDSSNTGIYAFKNFESDQKYKILLSEAEIDALTDVNGVFLYECLRSTCKVTSGYIKYHSGEKFADCDEEYGCEEESLDNGSSDNGSSSNGGIEVGYANLMENTMRLCIADGVLVGSTEASGRIGYIVDGILYKINTSGSIIGESQQDESYIDTENGNELITCSESFCEQDEDAAGYYYVYELSDSSKKKLYSCSSVSCTVEVDPSGYYYNKNNKKLYFCGGDCYEEPIYHGYLLNKYSFETKKGLKCNGSTCDETNDLTKSDCSNDQYKIIYHEGFKYCNGTLEIPLSPSISYYFVSDVKTSEINYPDDFLSEIKTDKQIIIKLEYYQVVQYYGYEVCIESNSRKTCITGEIKYECKESTPCEVDFVPCNNESTKEKCNGYYLIGSKLKLCTLGLCEEPQNLMGYFKSPNGQYIKCTSDYSTITCEYVTLGTVDTECEKGNLVDNSGNIGLCINNEKSDIVPIFNTKNDRYFIDASILYPGIGVNKYYIISIDINSVKVEVIPTDSPEEYLYTFGNLKILVQKENQCTNTEGTKIDNLIEFKKSDDEDNTYFIYSEA